MVPCDTHVCRIFSIILASLFQNVPVLPFPVSVLGAEFHVAVYKIQVCTHNLRFTVSPGVLERKKKCIENKCPGFQHVFVGGKFCRVFFFFFTACGDESDEMRENQELSIFSGEITSVECVNPNVKQCLLDFVYY